MLSFVMTLPSCLRLITCFSTQLACETAVHQRRVQNGASNDAAITACVRLGQVVGAYVHTSKLQLGQGVSNQGEYAPVSAPHVDQMLVGPCMLS